MRLNPSAECTDQDTYVDTVKMLDTFSKDIIYKELPPPYTQTLFIELIRFSPGQPDTVLTNGSSSHPSGTSLTSNHPPPNGHSFHQRTLPPPPPPRVPIHPYSPPHRINVPAAHMPPPPPWEIKWTRPVPPAASATLPPSVSAAVNATPASSSSSVRRLSVSSSSAVPVPGPAPSALPVAVINDDIRLPAVAPLTPPSASRKRKYPEGDVGSAGTERSSRYGSGSPSYKCRTPAAGGAEPMDHTPTQAPPLVPLPTSSSSSSSSSAPASVSSPAAPGPAPSGHRATQTLSPSLAMIMSPDTRHIPPFVVGTSSSASVSLPATPPQQQRKVKLTYTNGEGTPR